MSDISVKAAGQGRLSILAAAMVVARRDFLAVLWSRSFVAFLLGPLFMLAVTAAASGIGAKVEESAKAPVLGVAMAKADGRAFIAAGHRIETAMYGGVPDMVLAPDGDAGADNPARLLDRNTTTMNAVLTGTPAHPVLTGPGPLLDQWRGPVALIAAESTGDGPQGYPEVAVTPTAHADAPDGRIGRMRTAQTAQTVMFMLTMLLAGMVLSNLVEEKANKIIEILAAAVPMDAVFLGKLFAMLAISFVGIAVWGGAVGAVLMTGGRSLGEMAAPAVGWPAFFALGVAYFAMAYLLLGSVFLTIGSMASSVREVQTLSMPVTMLQLLVFFFSTYAMATPHAPMEQAAVPGLGQHALALGWKVVWVGLFVRMGATLFRRKVMKSGPAKVRSGKRGLVRA